MSVLAMLSLGFLGMVSTGFDGSGQIPIGDASSFGAAGIYAFPLKPRASSAPAGITFPNFKPSEFPFVTTVPDDGTDKGGGWQVAKVKLEFVRIVIPTDESLALRLQDRNATTDRVHGQSRRETGGITQCGDHKPRRAGHGLQTSARDFL